MGTATHCTAWSSGPASPRYRARGPAASSDTRSRSRAHTRGARPWRALAIPFYPSGTRPTQSRQRCDACAARGPQNRRSRRDHPESRERARDQRPAVSSGSAVAEPRSAIVARRMVTRRRDHAKQRARPGLTPDPRSRMPAIEPRRTRPGGCRISRDTLERRRDTSEPLSGRPARS
jgi:hypothetical protein